MADRRDDREQYRGERRDPELERRIDRRADQYRGSDERGYGGGEHLGREWETGDPAGRERSERGERLRSADEERYDWAGRGGEERFRRDWDERGFREAPRDHGERRFRDSGRDRDVVREQPQRHGGRSRPARLPSDAYRWSADVPRDFGEVRDSEGHHLHYNLAGLHDLDDLSDLRERYREHRHDLGPSPYYGHGPGVENMEAPRMGYGTSMTRRTSWDHELGHGGFISDVYGERQPRPSGRAPKGYMRSDDRIREDICDRLMMSWMNAENVEVLVAAGEVTLQGTVKSRDEKRAIEALAESVLGVKDIINSLRIERREQSRAEARPEAQEQRTQEQGQTSVQPSGDTSLHS